MLAFAEPYRNRMVLPIDETTVFREFGPLAGNAVQIGYRNAKIITPPAGFTVDALAI
jgi:hypothetical protein